MTEKWDESRYKQTFLMAQKGDAISRALLLEKYRRSRDEIPSYCLNYINQLLKNIEDDLRFSNKRASTKFFPDNPRKGTDISKKLAVLQDYEALISKGMSSKQAISEVANKWGYTTNNSNDAASAIHRVNRDAKSFISDSEAKVDEEVKRKLEIMTVWANKHGCTVSNYDHAEFAIRNNFNDRNKNGFLSTTKTLNSEFSNEINIYIMELGLLSMLRTMDNNPEDLNDVDVDEDVQYLDIPKFLANHADKQADRD
jgi:uncharacterized protein YoaH (UPF0181 family)